MSSVSAEQVSEHKLETTDEEFFSRDDAGVGRRRRSWSGGELSAEDLFSLHGSIGNQGVQELLQGRAQLATDAQTSLDGDADTSNDAEPLDWAQESFAGGLPGSSSIRFERYYTDLDEYARGRKNNELRTLFQLLAGYEASRREDAAGAMSAHDANLRLGQLEVIAEACKRLQLYYTAKLPDARNWRMNERQKRHDDKPLVKAQRKQEKAREKQQQKDAKQSAEHQERAHDILRIDDKIRLFSAMIQLNQSQIVELAQRTKGRKLTAEEGEGLEALQREQEKTRAKLVKQQGKLRQALVPRSVARVVSDEEKALKKQHRRDQEQTTLDLARMDTALVLKDNIDTIQLCIDALDQEEQLSSDDQERRSRLEADLEDYKRALILHSATRLKLPKSGKLEQLASGALALKATAQLVPAAIKQVPGAIKKTVSDGAGALAKNAENAVTSPFHYEIRLAEKTKQHDRRQEVKAARRRGIVTMLLDLQTEIIAERRRIEQTVARRDTARLDDIESIPLFRRRGLLSAAKSKVVSGVGKVAGRYSPAKIVAGEHVPEEGILLRPALFDIAEMTEIVRLWGAFEEELEGARDRERNRSTVLVQWRSRGDLPVNLLPVDTSPGELLAARARILMIEMELREKNAALLGKKTDSDGLVRQAIKLSGKAKAIPIAGVGPTTMQLLMDMVDIVAGDHKKKASARQHIQFHILDVCTQLNKLGALVDVGAVAGEFIPYANIPIAMIPVLINALRLLLVELEREMFTDALKHADKDDPLRIPFAQIEKLLLEREARLTVAAGTSVVRTAVAIGVNAVPVPGVGAAAGVLGMVTTGAIAAEDFVSSQSRAVKAKGTRNDFLSGGAGVPALEHDPKTALLSIIKSARDNCVAENPSVRIIESLGVKRNDIRNLEPQELLSMFMMVLDLSEDPENLRGTISDGLTSVGEKLTKARRRIMKHSRQELSDQDKKTKSSLKKELKEDGLTFHDVSGAGLNCLIRALLLASVHHVDEKVVSDLRRHLEAQRAAVAGDLLDVAGLAGAVLLSEMERRGLLDKRRAVLLYTPEMGAQPIQIVEGDMEQPIRLWLEGAHFQVIAAPGPGKVARAKEATKSVATTALAATSAGRAYFREQSTIDHIQALEKIADDIQKAVASDGGPFGLESLQTLQNIVLFALGQKLKKKTRAHHDIFVSLLPIESLVGAVGSAAGTAMKVYQGKPRGNRESYARELIGLAKERGAASALAMDVLHNLLDGDKEAINLALSHDEGWKIVANKLRSR